MSLNKTRIPIKDLHSRSDFPFAPLEGVGPNLAGWGVIETCLLLPESVAVMVGPSACLRHSAFMAHARGFTERFHMLCTSELDMSLGNHLEKVERGLMDIASRRSERVIFLIVGCPDYILGTDFGGVIHRLEEATGKHVILGAMAPITIGMKESPFTSAYTSFFDFLENVPRTPDDASINILGTFMPLADSSELYSVLRDAGFSTITQIPLCSTLEEFSRMAHARASLLLHPLASGLAGKMADVMGQESLVTPTAYGFSTIAGHYQRMGETLGAKLDTASREHEARTKAAPMLESLRGKAAAVGCSINGSTFELARFLVESGVDLRAVFARGTIKPFEWEHIEALRDLVPDLPIYNASHPALCGRTEPFNDVEIAYGVDAGIFCVNAANVPLSRYQEQFFGYENTLWMLEQTHEALKNPVDNRDWIYGHNFLI